MAVNGVKFAATGGVPPYTFSLPVEPRPPPATRSWARTGPSSWNPASTAGSYTFPRDRHRHGQEHRDSKASRSKVNAAPLTVATTPLALGMVGTFALFGRD